MSETNTKRKVLIFSKLESFRRAAQDVRHLIENIFENDQSFEITSDVKRNRTAEDDDSNTVTAVVVIDARQTRTLITPERRDRNVDHWDELHMLSTTVTNPRDSILLVIYGDERSRELNNSDLVAPTWLTTWRYNDEIAFSLTCNQRCFSIWDNFNESQVMAIRTFIEGERRCTVEYFREITDFDAAKCGKVSLSSQDINVLVIGEGPLTDKHYTQLPDGVDTSVIKITKYTDFNYNIARNGKQRALIIHQIEGVTSTHLADSSCLLEILSNWTERKSLPRRTNSVEINLVVISAHCRECVDKISEMQSLIKEKLKIMQEKCRYVIKGEILPTVSNQVTLCFTRYMCEHGNARTYLYRLYIMSWLSKVLSLSLLRPSAPSLSLVALMCLHELGRCVRYLSNNNDFHQIPPLPDLNRVLNPHFSPRSGRLMPCIIDLLKFDKFWRKVLPFLCKVLVFLKRMLVIVWLYKNLSLLRTKMSNEHADRNSLLTIMSPVFLKFGICCFRRIVKRK
ncbi:uncharacterized protein [Ptychodera flava]|uniref:uncharacterized protein n=1 Tax=Ptychodera flava TaxID=63121 RepID=UPI00396A5F01